MKLSVCCIRIDATHCPHYHHHGRTSVDYVSMQLRLDPHSTTMCTFPMRDLDVQGELCAFVIAVADVPSPRNTGITREDARDVFVLLDARPFGIKPQFLHLQHPVVHRGNTVTYTHVFSSLIHISFASLIHRKVRNHCKLPMKMHLRGCRRQTKREQQERQTGSQQQCFSRTSLKMHFSRLQKCVLDNLSEKNSLQSCVQVGGVGGGGWGEG